MEPPADTQKTWPNWKNHWTQAFNLNRAIQCLAGSIFCANATIEDELSEKMVTSLDNLANAVVQKNDTIEKLIETNKQQQETIHNLQAQNGELLYLLKHLGGGALILMLFPRKPDNHLHYGILLDTAGHMDMK